MASDSDIDCSVDLRDRQEHHDSLAQKAKINDSQITLSGLLNFIDGLWSCCGDERIIIFTTNHKDRIDPALLRPGRMDMHILMSYCTPQAFQTLASNYLGISSSSADHHPLFPEIQAMLQSVDATPAELAEELMKSEDPDEALAEVVNLLKRKRAANINAQAQVDPHEAKRQKVGEQLIN